MLSKHSISSAKDLKSFPKIELHQHLEGSITAEMILEFDEKHKFNLHSRNYGVLQNSIIYNSPIPSLSDFLSKFSVIEKLFTSSEILFDLTKAILQAAERENILHLELRYSPSYISKTVFLTWDEVTSAIVRAVQEFSIHSLMTIRPIPKSRQ